MGRRARLGLDRRAVAPRRHQSQGPKRQVRDAWAAPRGAGSMLSSSPRGRGTPLRQSTAIASRLVARRAAVVDGLLHVGLGRRHGGVHRGHDVRFRDAPVRLGRLRRCAGLCVRTLGQLRSRADVQRGFLRQRRLRVRQWPGRGRRAVRPRLGARRRGVVQDRLHGGLLRRRLRRSGRGVRRRQPHRPRRLHQHVPAADLRGRNPAGRGEL